MMTRLSLKGMKHKKENRVLRRGKEPTPSGSGTKLNFMSYSAAREAENEANVKPPFNVTGVDN